MASRWLGYGELKTLPLKVGCHNQSQLGDAEGAGRVMAVPPVSERTGPVV